MARSLALFIGGFLLANLLLGGIRPGLDQAVLLLDFRRLPRSLVPALVAGASGLLLAWAVAPRPGEARRVATCAAALVLAGIALENSVVFYRLLAAERFRPALPVPLTALAAAGLLSVAVAVLRGRDGSLAGTVGGAVAVAAVFPLLLVCFVGTTDYRQRADCAVVFGARAHADGAPSRVIGDRVRTAAALYRDGLVPRLILSGGPGDGEVHETEAMRRLAVRLGVPETAILVDAGGVNTRATAAAVREIVRRHDLRTVLVVSNDFHLPRIRVAFRQAGLEVRSVPARESAPPRGLPFLLARETAAFWAYWALRR